MPNSDSQPVKIKRNNFSQTPISCLPQNSCLNSANDIPSSSYGPSFIRAKQLNDIHKSGLLCKESLSKKAHSNSRSHNDRCPIDLNTIAGHKNILRARNPSKNISFMRTSASLSSSARLKSCDVYIGTHGKNTIVLHFTKWLRAKLEMQGTACFAADRARYRDSRSHDIANRVLSSATFLPWGC